MTKRTRATGLKLRGRSFGQHPKDGPVKHVHFRRRRARKPTPEPPESPEPKAETETGSEK